MVFRGTIEYWVNETVVGVLRVSRPCGPCSSTRHQVCVVNCRKCSSSGRPSLVRSAIVPSKINRPSSMNSTRLAMASTSCRMCVESRIVLLLPSLRIVSRTSWIWFGIQPGRRLVEDQHVGLVQQHVGHAHALPVAAGELADGLADHRVQGAQLDHGVDPLALPLAGQAAGVGKEAQQRAGRHVEIERAVFGQIAQPGGAGQAVGGHIVPGDAGRPAEGAR